jgi:hypothetical protein
MTKKLYQPRWQTLRAVLICGGAIVAVIAGRQSFAGADNPVRYPYDPACPWGRIADGNGMLVRCLLATESSQLMASSHATRPVGAAPANGTIGAPGTVGGTGDAFTPVEAAPPAVALKGNIRVDSVGPAVADAGELPLADKKLAVAKDRFVECVAKNGGLSSKQAKIVVRFLVRERGRAEGVGVKSFNGVSQAAAECIADVVNLRYVGYPAAPIVGATIPIVLSVYP